MSQSGPTQTGGNLPGNIIQVVSNTTSSLITTTSLMKLDDTIPQQTEGTQILTTTITPNSATNRLVVIAVTWCTLNDILGQGNAVFALFQDASLDAVAACCNAVSPATNVLTRNNAILYTIQVAGTTSPTTFKLRGGPAQAGETIYVNGAIGTRYFGGVSNTILTIYEVET